MIEKEISPETRAKILRILQYEGKEKLMPNIELVSKILGAINLNQTKPIDAISALVSVLGFTIMLSTKNNENRMKAVLLACQTLVENSKTTQADLDKKYDELKKSGLI